ncbi:molybdopterin-dependent oxidoreductase [Hymenobacter sp. ASUV-10]|uniref:Molybdopterin-dependent oxidoreductase n=1 Tax=Hymenobacter aranciens TaxID=3063996 RepID=A0ABT9BCD1_9BACT|nr:molybdopterin-dependent oxidoreductase [Hymenobacter sp. ASUV-10]MDO7875917.1 molybdopterin-dependent oxidoreductase [Hymenobacter sp. ASUV-10]
MMENEETPQRPAASDAATEAEAVRRSRRAFIGWGLAGLAGLGGWGWLVSRPQEGGIPGPLRRVLEFNENVSGAYFKETRLAPEFARSRATTPRVNGKYGLEDELDPAAWRLRVQSIDGQAREFTLADVQALPKIEMVTELKCIEGWSVIVHWAGARMADFLSHYQLPAAVPYLLLQTPNEKYYVGLDLKSALHPQTLLCYEMNGRRLTPAHGAPLRLVTPLKYGIKHLKRLGSIAFTTERPKDFWAERGYDWDSGH